MKRRSLLGRAGLAGVLAAGVAPAVHAQPLVRWRLASSFPRSLDTLFGAAEFFAGRVRALSGGRFEVQAHEADTLMPAFAVVEGVGSGAAEMAHTASYYFSDKNPVFALGCAVPFGLNSRQLTAWMLEGNGLKLMREFYAGYHIVNFPGGNTGAQMGGWFRKEVRSAKDLQGLRFRIAGFAGLLMARMGAEPVNLPAGHIYAALDRGEIDAAEWVGPYDDQKLGFVKVAPYYYYPGFWEGSTQFDFYVNQKAWGSLSAEHKAIVEAAAAQTHVQVQAKYDALNPGALKQLVASGAKLRPFPADVLADAFKHANDIYAETSAKNEQFRRIYADMAKFRADQNLWFRFTEATFDRFMQAQKL